MLTLETRRMGKRFRNASHYEEAIQGKSIPDYFASTYKDSALYSISPPHIYLLGTYRDHEAYGFIQALERLGSVSVYHDPEGNYGINFFASREGLPVVQQTDSHIVREIRKVHEKNPISFVIGTLLASTVSLKEIQEIRKLGIPVLNIAMDDRVPHNWKTINSTLMGAIGLSDAVDITLQTSPDFIPRYTARNNYCVYWPFGSDPDIFHQAPNKDIDVVFVGNKYGKRGPLIRQIQKAGIQIECFGNDFANGHIPGSQVPELFARARIILGTGLIGHSSSITTLKLRDFDGPMSGGLYVTSHNRDLEKLYKCGKEIITYKSISECVELIQYFLVHHEEREEIARAGRIRALSEHTWDARMKQLKGWLALP